MPQWQRASFPTLDNSIPQRIRQALDWCHQTIEQLRGSTLPLALVARGDKDKETLVLSDPNIIPGCQLILERPGTWIIVGLVKFKITGAGDTGKQLMGLLRVGVQDELTKASLMVPAQPAELAAIQIWSIKLSGSTPIKLMVQKEATGSGASTIDCPNCCLTAIWGGE
jgi:hypothetical protein